MIVAKESVATDRATFAMHCFWEGQVKLGALPGVVHTRAGWLDGEEVVQVDFDPKAISYKKLVRQADELSCAGTVFAISNQQVAVARDLVSNRMKRVAKKTRARDAKPTDDLYHLRKSSSRYLPLTRGQGNRINAA